TLVIRHDLPLGLNYLYAPHPDFSRFTSHITRDTVLREIENIAAQEKSVFLKIDPLTPLVICDTCLVYRAARSLQPRETIMIDLTQSEETLLAAMHGKTRYNIGLAERKGVVVKNFQFSIFNFYQKKFETFCRLLRETATRDGFRAHPKEYYKKLLGRSHGQFPSK
ncbi:MAG: pentaglycine interpeptide bridge formation protein, partial [Parcubacteria group bacterium Greene0714_36]